MEERTKSILESLFMVAMLLLVLNIVILAPAWCRLVLPDSLAVVTVFLPILLAIAVQLLFNALGSNLIERSGAYVVPGVVAIFGWLPAVLLAVEIEDHQRLVHQPDAMDFVVAEAAEHRDADYMRLRDGVILARRAATVREEMGPSKGARYDVYTHVAPVVAPGWSPREPVRVWAVSTASAPDFLGPVAGMPLAHVHDSHRRAMAKVEAIHGIRADPEPVLLRLEQRSNAELLANQERRVRNGFLLVNALFGGAAIAVIVLGYRGARAEARRRLPRAWLRRR